MSAARQASRMALYAIDDLDEALEATRSFLLPFDLRRWLRLAVLAFFVAAGAGGGFTPPSGFRFEGMTPRGGVPVEDVAATLTHNLGVVVAVAAVVVAVGLVAAWLSATMEFAFLDALRSGDVAVRAGVRRHAGRGTRLFLFRLALAVVGLAFAAAALAVTVAPMLAGRGDVSVLVFLALVPAFFALAVVFGGVYAFTTFLVAPVMLLEDRGVLSAWRRLWPTLRGEWEQFLTFAVVGFVLVVAAGIVVGLAAAAVSVALAIPFAVVAAVVGVTGGLGPATLAVLGVVGAALGVVVLAVVAVAQVPVQSYLRYWALLVLGDADDELDLVPERRAEVRAES
jgi:hypothetical protein